MSLVADTSTLIFLAKLDQIEVLEKLFQKPFEIPHYVAEEIWRNPLGIGELERLKKTLSSWKVIPTEVKTPQQSGLSQTDWAVYTLAIKINADWVLADDRLLRSALRAAGLKTLGTLGVLLLAVHQKILDRKKAKELAAELILKHNFHIDVRTYELFLKQLKI